MSMKTIVRTVLQVGILYLFFLLGQLIARFFDLIIPGSIIGLLLLLTGLLLRVIPASLIKDGAKLMILFLPLFFIPATVGIVQYPEFLSVKGVLLILIVVVSTCISLALTGWTSQFFEQRETEGKKL